MSRAPYSVTVKVADLTWTVDYDPADDTPATPLLGPVAPLTIRESLPDDKPVPAQPDPPIATFGLAAADAADLAGVVKGAECHVAFTATGNPDPIYFDGNVSDVVLTPAKVRDGAGGPLVFGVIAQVVAVGYLAQLFDETATIDEPTDHGPYTWTSLRFLDLMTDATFGSVSQTLSPAGYDWDWSDRRASKSIAGESIGPHLVDLFDTHPIYEVGDLGGKVAGRIIIQPIIDPADRSLQEYDPAQPFPQGTWLLSLGTPPDPIAPGVFGDSGAGYGVAFPAAAGDDPLINGRHVDRAISFVQRKGTNVTKTVVRYLDADAGNKARSTSKDNGVKPTTTHTIDTDLVKLAADPGEVAAAAIANDLATLYLPPANLAAWGVDEITWRLYDDVPGRRPPKLGQLIVIAPIPASQNPNKREWLTGLVAGWMLTVAGGRPTVTLELRAGSAAGSAPGLLTVDELPDGVTVDQLHAKHTIDDYELIGG